MNLKKPFQWIVITGIVTASCVVYAAPPTDLAEVLVGLRSEVEQLGDDITMLRQEMREETLRLRQQNAELEGEKRRAQTRLKRIALIRAQVEEKNAAMADKDRDLIPMVEESAQHLLAYIDGSIPFRKEERRKAVLDVQKDVANKQIPASEAASRLWGYAQDEMRLTRESGIYRQTITLGQDDILADVLRLGMNGLFFKTPDERYGRVVREQDTWNYLEYKDQETQRQVSLLFDAFKKQVRTGYFEIPTVWQESQVSQ